VGTINARWIAFPSERSIIYLSLLKDNNQERSREIKHLLHEYKMKLCIREKAENYRFAIELIPVKDIYPTNLASSRLILQKPLRNLLGNHRCVAPSTIVNENVRSYSLIHSYPQQF